MPFYLGVEEQRGFCRVDRSGKGILGRGNNVSKASEVESSMRVQRTIITGLHYWSVRCRVGDSER